MRTEKAIILSAPSGAGKTTVLKRILPQYSEIGFSISATSREKRVGEQENRDYIFLSASDFSERIREGAFLEWEEVYPGLFYGTLRSEVERLWDQNKTAFFDVDVHGGMKIKKELGERALSIFLKPPSLEVLEQRLLARGSESKDSLRARIERAKMELSYASTFDYCVVNEELEKTVVEVERIISQFLSGKK